MRRGLSEMSARKEQSEYTLSLMKIRRTPARQERAPESARAGRCFPAPTAVQVFHCVARRRAVFYCFHCYLCLMLYMQLAD